MLHDVVARSLHIRMKILSIQLFSLNCALEMGVFTHKKHQGLHKSAFKKTFVDYKMNLLC